MYGLEKKGKGLFEFDLEKELKSQPNKTQDLLKTVERNIHDIKNSLRQGAASEDYDKLGILLQGYMALQKVLTKAAKK